MTNDAILSRLRWRLSDKLKLAVALNVAVLAAYAWAQRRPLFPATPIPETTLDRAVPFMPGWAPVYLSLNLYLPFGLLPVADAVRFRRYVSGVLAIGVVGFVCFLFFPTTCHRPADTDSALMTLLHRIDTPANACPSLHAAFVVFTGLTFRDTCRNRPVAVALVAAWGAVILFATIAVRQHVSLDLLAGASLGIAGYLAPKTFFNRTPPCPASSSEPVS